MGNAVERGASAEQVRGIGQLSERSLHAALKEHLAQPGDQFEFKLGRNVIDIARDGLLIEIQTRHLYALRPKLSRLLESHRVRVVHPLPFERWIVREHADGRNVRRKSPRHAAVHDIFGEVVRVPDLVGHPNLSLEVLLIREEQTWRDDGLGSWRRGHWSLADTRLLGVASSQVFSGPGDYLALLPGMEPTFSNADLAKAKGWNSRIAGRATYALKAMGMLEVAGRQGRSNVFQVVAGEEGSGADDGIAGVSG